MNKFKSFIVRLLQIPICTCGNLFESNRGIRTGITMEEARTYLIRPPHSVRSGQRGDGSRYVTWGWTRFDKSDAYITCIDGVVTSYHGITPELARVAMPTEVTQSSIIGE